MPSWSWTAYDGGIDYITPALGTVDWDASISIYHDLDSDPDKGTFAKVWSFDFSGNEKGEDFIVYDDPDDFDSRSKAKCVVLGKAKGMTTPMSRKCYVLIVSPRFLTASITLRESRGEFLQVYSRIGVGILSSLRIDEKGPETKVHIL